MVFGTEFKFWFCHLKGVWLGAEQGTSVSHSLSVLPFRKMTIKADSARDVSCPTLDQSGYSIKISFFTFTVSPLGFSLMLNKQQRQVHFKNVFSGLLLLNSSLKFWETTTVKLWNPQVTCQDFVYRWRENHCFYKQGHGSGVIHRKEVFFHLHSVLELEKLKRESKLNLYWFPSTFTQIRGRVRKWVLEQLFYLWLDTVLGPMRHKLSLEKLI